VSIENLTCGDCLNQRPNWSRVWLRGWVSGRTYGRGSRRWGLMRVYIFESKPRALKFQAVPAWEANPDA
jgi:hypothetical protein